MKGLNAFYTHHIGATGIAAAARCGWWGALTIFGDQRLGRSLGQPKLPVILWLSSAWTSAMRGEAAMTALVGGYGLGKHQFISIEDPNPISSSGRYKPPNLAVLT
ncbi:MAG: hypothetical protein HC910_02395 [Spirulinaceae cyanobacterium SM2_1_0]|nr:hypothetical protein [Spirulinaceae cyanobacterium SM2_1_0]